MATRGQTTISPTTTALAEAVAESIVADATGPLVATGAVAAVAAEVAEAVVVAVLTVATTRPAAMGTTTATTITNAVAETATRTTRLWRRVTRKCPASYKQEAIETLCMTASKAGEE
jgi:hypothetical protein